MNNGVKLCRIPGAILYDSRLTPAEKVLLGLAWSFPDGLQLSNAEIGRILCKHQVTVSRIIKKLEADGWLKITGNQSRWRRIYFNNDVKVKDGDTLAFCDSTLAFHSVYFSPHAKQNRRIEKEKKEISPFFADAEPSQDATILDDWEETEATDYVFVLQDGSQWYLPDEKFTEYNRTFVDIDVAAELRKAAQWLRDNPGRRKTARGMPRFLSGWLGRVESKKPAKALRELPEANFRAVFNKLGVPRDIQDKLEAEGWTV